MIRKLTTFSLFAAGLIGLSACGVAKTTTKVATLPVKATVKTGELAGKGVYHTGKGVVNTGEMAGKGVYYTGKGAYHTGELAGKGAYYTGKGAYHTGKAVYYVGTVPVEITDRALDTTSKVLTVTTQAVDLAGKAVVYTKQIQAANLEAELERLKAIRGIVRIFVDAA